jgi:DNA uptake protein ComE-like DNA-binding protein
MGSKRSGYILIFTLAILTAVIAVLAGAAAMQRLGADSQINREDQGRAKIMADSALQLAITTLSTQSTTAASQGDAWYALGTQGNDNFKLDSGSFRIQIVDPGSLINVNTASQQQLENLPLTTDQVDCLLDWRSAGTTPRSDGAKDEYYNGLVNPYNTAETPLQSVDELLLIKNWTPATLFSTNTGVQTTSPQPTSPITGDPLPLYVEFTTDSASTNNSAQGRAKINANTATAQQMLQAGVPANVVTQIIRVRGSNRTAFANYAALLGVPGVNATSAAAILNNLGTGAAATQTGKLNLNTVTQDILTTVPNLGTDIAQAIITKQTSGFTALGDLASVPGVTIPILRQIADLFTVNATAFLVRVEGTAGQVKYPLEAIITLKNSTAQLTKIMHPPMSNMRANWGWQDTTTNDVDLTTGAQ